MTLYAKPFMSDFSGFYFDDEETFIIKTEELNNSEFEIQFVDGDDCQDNYQAELFEEAFIDQSNLHLWFDGLSTLYGDNILKAIFLIRDIGYSAEEALSLYDRVILFRGTRGDYAESVSYDRDDIPEHYRRYIDWDLMGRHWQDNGEIIEIESDVWATNALEF